MYDSNKYESATGYQRSLQKTSVPEDGNFGVFALDCEMVYTSRGSEIGRVCLVNQQLEPVSAMFSVCSFVRFFLSWRLPRAR